MTQSTVSADVATCRGVIEAIQSVAYAGQTLAGARRQVEMAESEFEEAQVAYFEAQKILTAAVSAARTAAGEPVNL